MQKFLDALYDEFKRFNPTTRPKDWHDRLKALIEQEKRAAQLDIDHVVEVMEAGRELERQYAKYGGDMDWIEFVQTHYVNEVKRLDKGQTP